MSGRRYHPAWGPEGPEAYRFDPHLERLKVIPCPPPTCPRCGSDKLRRGKTEKSADGSVTKPRRCMSCGWEFCFMQEPSVHIAPKRREPGVMYDDGDD